MLRRKKILFYVAIIPALLLTQAVSEAANFVSPEQVNLAKLLAPPPWDHSSRTQAEIGELIRIQKESTPQERSAAMADDRLSVFQFASSILGPAFTVANAPLNEELFRRLSKDAISIFTEPKEKWNRSRPFAVSGELKACFEHASSGAYPSGHSTFGYLTAVVLADMIPEKGRNFSTGPLNMPETAWSAASIIEATLKRGRLGVRSLPPLRCRIRSSTRTMKRP
jgi:acid phosphatase (class A)